MTIAELVHKTYHDETKTKKDFMNSLNTLINHIPNDKALGDIMRTVFHNLEKDNHV